MNTRTPLKRELAHPNVNFYLAPGDKLVQCPYDSTHVILEQRFTNHLGKCQRNYNKARTRDPSMPEMIPCMFNWNHHIPKNLYEEHKAVCPEAIEAQNEFPDMMKGAVEYQHKKVSDATGGACGSKFNNAGVADHQLESSMNKLKLDNSENKKNKLADNDGGVRRCWYDGSARSAFLPPEFEIPTDEKLYNNDEDWDTPVVPVNTPNYYDHFKVNEIFKATGLSVLSQKEEENRKRLEELSKKEFEYEKDALD